MINLLAERSSWDILAIVWTLKLQLVIFLNAWECVCSSELNSISNLHVFYWCCGVVWLTVRVKIFDDDVDFETLLPENINNTLDDDIGDDSPAVAEFVDERPKHVKELERFRQSNQWKLVSLKPGN